MDAREIESLSMLQRGFAELKDANPQLAYNVIVDILQGINEYVISFILPSDNLSEPRGLAFSNSSLKQHVQTSRGLFPHKRIIRKSEMTSKGLVVTEEQEEISGLPFTSGPADSITSPPPSATDTPPSPSRKSPIAELLYMRWLEGLKLKWPNIIS
jgi:serine/threonine-protein kinase 24/25/MST4